MENQSRASDHSDAPSDLIPAQPQPCQQAVTPCKRLQDRQDEPRTLADAWNHWPTRIQMLIAVAATVYCGLTFGLWWQAKRATDVGERAYLTLASFGINEMDGTAIVQFRNTGHTPAINVRHLGTFQINGIPGIEPDDPFLLGGGSVPIDLGAGEVEIPPIPLRIPQAMWDLAKSSKDKVLYVTFRASYDDVFNKGDYTDVCGQYLPDKQMFQSCGTHLK